MKHLIILFCFLLSHAIGFSQIKKITDPLTPCNGTADDVAGIYTDHTNPKYGSHSIKGTATTKPAMTKNLIAIEKLEEASRKDFKLTGCAARVSFSGGGSTSYGKSTYTSYGYQLGVYAYVCHVKELTTKIVGEYQTVLRININPDVVFGGNSLRPGTGDLSFSKTATTLMWSYDFPADALLGPNYESDRIKNPSKVSTYISESNLLAGRSSAYKSYHDDFLKLNAGNGYTENYMRGSLYDKVTENSYRLIDRRYLITKPGIPLLIPVSRKQYLQDMLEYFEIEKANFNYRVDELLKNSATNNSDFGIQQKKTWQAHKAACTQHYEAKKAKVKELLATKSEEWLQQPAVVAGGNATKDVTQRLAQTGVFYEMEDYDKNIFALYVLNPAYFTTSTGPSTTPTLIEVSFRYELNKDKGFSERLINNFEKNFDFEALRKMLDSNTNKP
ncbi:MAG TPA: hypothetical protein PKH83_02610 [Cyclobacteriaceae bacterium]|nr:hypothetical protein [Cyclobacteriaceae bacterium]HNU41354.1 hypothetical protein [Cyclobacteriaceae bacterium]